MKRNKKVEAALLVFFGIELIAMLYGYLIDWFGLYHRAENFNFIFYFLLNLARCITFIFIFALLPAQSNAVAKVGALTCSFLYFLYFLNIIIIKVSQNYIFSFMGYYSDIVLDLLFIVGMAMLLFSARIWTPLKVTGFIPVFLSIFITLSRLGLMKQYVNFDYYDYSKINFLTTMLQIFDVLTILGYLVATCVAIGAVMRKSPYETAFIDPPFPPPPPQIPRNPYNY